MMIADILEDLINNSILPSVEETVGIKISKWRQMRMKETKCLLKRNGLKKMIKRKIVTNDTRDLTRKLKKAGKNLTNLNK